MLELPGMVGDGAVSEPVRGNGSLAGVSHRLPVLFGRVPGLRGAGRPGMWRSRGKTTFTIVAGKGERSPKQPTIHHFMELVSALLTSEIRNRQ